MAEYTQRSFSTLMKENQNQYFIIFSNKVVFKINMVSYSNIFNRSEMKILDQITKLLNQLPYSLETESTDPSNDAVCKILHLESLLQDFLQRISDVIRLDFDNVFFEKYKDLYSEIKMLYDNVETLSFNLQIIYNHIFVNIKNMYSNLRCEIEKNIINDSILYKKCLSYYGTLDFNFRDTSYKNVCKIIMTILSLKNIITKHKKIVSYYDKRMEKTQEMWKSVELEFFGIAYSPDIVKKTVWSDQEYKEYINMFKSY